MKADFDHYKEDEIDLVDLLRILLKRKWIILSLIIIAFITSSSIVLLSSRNKYRATILITPPQVYKVEENNSLSPSYPQLATLVDGIKSKLNENTHTIVNEESKYSYSYKLDTINEKIKIELTGNKEKIKKAVLTLYPIYTDFEYRIENENNETFDIIQDTLQSTLIQKKEMKKKLTQLLDNRAIKNSLEGNEDALLYIINSSGSDIMEIEEIIGANETIQLAKADFSFTNIPEGGVSLNQDNLEKAGFYIVPERSKKSKLVTIILSIAISLLVGIFMAYIVEFSIREGVKRKLKKQ